VGPVLLVFSDKEKGMLVARRSDSGRRGCCGRGSSSSRRRGGEGEGVGEGESEGEGEVGSSRIQIRMF